MKKKTKRFHIEKETTIREVRGEKMVKTEYRIIVNEGNSRAIVMTTTEFKDLKKQIDLFLNEDK